jgi:hypothetical protein
MAMLFPFMVLRADEVVQLILNELDDPTNFSLLSKRLHVITQDPYVRACYFISRYGKIQALYWALGRGRLMTDQVIDVRLYFTVFQAIVFLKPPFS